MIITVVTWMALILPATDDAKVAKPFIASGSIKSVGKDEEAGKKLVARDKKGTLDVQLGSDTLIESHRISSIKDVIPGSTLHILARKQAEQLGTGGARYPPMLIQIQAIVAGSFRPPAVPAKFSGQGFSWVSGSLKSVESGREREVANYRLGTSLGTEVLLIERRKASFLKKRQKIFLSGYLDDSDRKNRKLEAVEIMLLESRWKKYDATHDLKNRKPPPKKDEDEESEEDEELPF